MKTSANIDYQKTVNFLFNLEPRGIRLGLKNSVTLLGALNNPHKKHNSVLVAGTNGKGSTAGMIAAIGSASGLKVGLYTSPHLEDFRERIRINGVQISEESVVSLTNRICALEQIRTASLYPTYFEFVTALMFLYFAEENVDLAVLEVGMGGRLDATNIVSPLVSVITEIDMDHSSVLGKDIESIAREKGGIIKPHGDVVLASQKREVISQITDICEKNSATLSLLGLNYICERVNKSKTGQTFCFKSVTKGTNLDNVGLSMLGTHQIKNAATAIETALILRQSGYVISESDIRNSLSVIKHNGRLEVIHKSPEVIIDMAHNPNAAASLAKTLIEDFEYNKLYLVIGVMEDKDIKGIMGILAPLAGAIIICKPQTPRAADPQLLKNEAKKYTANIKIVEKVSNAVSEALSTAAKSDMICITGSCYTIGEARKLFYQ